MTGKRELARQLSQVAGFENPAAALEQYATPAAIAATLVHTAGLHDDIGTRLVVDLGCGTGMLALASAVAGAAEVVGIDIDPDALAVARDNERAVGPETAVSWVRGEIPRVPFAPTRDVTVLMNPPFGAQSGNEHADRAFLETAASLAVVSYSIHNAGSAAFVESYATDHGGEVTHAFEATFELPRTFDFHDHDSRSIDAEVFRISW
ncbi:methyltransferase [Halovenus aranensis]|jgi:putative methylase|uniref:Methyltransferase n=1 Tax=Halovenus aranensis TaxID=890420 RepID=A0A1G8Z0U5_9EURY|nr:METTL5 family protein [Halovenus aranensis]SDK07935.1 methyltransferase [Halovenus aranensis]